MWWVLQLPCQPAHSSRGCGSSRLSQAQLSLALAPRLQFSELICEACILSHLAGSLWNRQDVGSRPILQLGKLRP